MQDAQIKKQNYRDHLTEMFSGLDAVTKTNASEMKSNFGKLESFRSKSLPFVSISLRREYGKGNSRKKFRSSS